MTPQQAREARGTTRRGIRRAKLRKALKALQAQKIVLQDKAGAK